MANTTKKAQVLITLNAQQATQTIKDMSRLALILADDIDEARKRFEEFTKQGNTAAAKQEEKFIADATKRMQAYTTAISKTVEQTKTLGDVIADLGNSKLRDLKRAMGQGKSQLQSLTGSDADLKKAEQIRKEMKQIGDQIKLIEGQYVQIGQSLGILNQKSDQWLSKAITQQRDLVSSLDKTDGSYKRQLATLQALEAEEARRRAGMNYQQAMQMSQNTGAPRSVNQLQTARKVLESHMKDTTSQALRDQDIRAIAEIDKQLDELQGKIKQTSLSWKQMRKVLASPDHATGEDIKKTMDIIQQKIAKLPAGSQRVADLRKQYQLLEQTLKGTKKEVVDVNDVLARSKQGKANIDELRRAYKQLEDELNKINTADPAFKNKQKDLKQLKKQIDEVTGAAQKQGGAWHTALKNLTAYVGMFAVFNQVKTYFVDLFKLNAQFSEQLTNIRKVALIANNEVATLSRELSKIETRTSIEDLNQIAYAGAKLGVQTKGGIDALAGFVRAADQVNVALKEDLGEEALTALAKITEVSGLMDKMGVEQAMLKTGSAIFRLASTSTAASGPIVDFTNRLLAMGKEGSLTTADILALGAAVDSMALEPEVASTAFNKLIVEIRKGTTSIEQDLGIAQGRLKQLVEEGKGMQALQEIFHKMNESKNVFALDGLFGDMGSEGGARMVKTMVTMAKNVEMLDRAVKESNTAFDEGIAVTNEYNMQQETATAYMERAANLWEKQFVSADAAQGPIRDLAKAWYEVSQELTHSIGFMTEVKITITLLFAAIKTFLGILPAVITALSTAGLAGAFTKLMLAVQSAGAQGLTFKGVLDILITKYKALNTVMKAGVWGAVIGLMGVAIVKAVEWTASLNKMAAGQQAVNEVEAEAKRKLEEEKNALERLHKVMNDGTAPMEIRLKAMKTLNEKIPDLNAKIDSETGKVQENTKAWTKNLEKLKQVYLVMGAKEKLAELGRQRADAVVDLEEKEDAYANTNVDVSNTTRPQTSGGAYMPSQAQGAIGQAGQKAAAKSARDKAKQKLDDIDARIAAMDKIIKSNPMGEGNNVDDDENEVGGGGGGGKKGGSGNGKNNNDMTIAKDRANALIANIKAFYEEQERAYLEWVAKMNETEETVTKEEQARRISEFEENKKRALGTARQSIATLGTEWETYLKDELPKHMFNKDDEVSKQLVEAMGKSDIKGLHALFEKLSGDLSRENNRTLSENLGALLDQIFANGSKELREAAEKLLERQRELYAILNRDKFVDNVNQQTRGNLDKWQFLTPANGIDANTEQGQRQLSQGFRELISKTRSQVHDLYEMLLVEDEKKFEDQMHAFLAAATQNFDFSNIKGKELHALLLMLIDDERNYEKALKDTDAQMKQRNDEAWLKDPRNKAYTESIRDMENALTFQKMYGKPKSNIEGYEDPRAAAQKKRERDEPNGGAELQTSWRGVGEGMGFEFKIDNDPELLLIEERMKREREAFMEKQRLHELGQASDEEYNESLKTYLSSLSAYSDRVLQDISSQTDALMSFMSPIMTFGEAVGDAFATMREDSEQGKKAMQQALKQMIKSFATQSLQLIMKNEQEQANMAMHYATMIAMRTAFGQAELQAEQANAAAMLATQSANNAAEVNLEAIKEQQKVALRSAGIFGWCVSTLGPIAGPIAYSAMMATLMGLLNYALSFIGGGDKGKSADVKGPNTKVVSGMLTYDSGNVQTVIGDDGKVYNAVNGEIPAKGVNLLTQPTVANVNGQKSLIAEQGPEFVIGRETTRALMMRPDLLQQIKTLDNANSGRRLRTYDTGNLADISASTTSAVAPGASEGSVQRDPEMLAIMTALLQRLNEPIKASINMYGRDGLYESNKKAQAFMKGKS